MIDPTQQAAAPQSAAPSITVCIESQGDGSFLVYEKGDANPTMQGGHATSSDEKDEAQTAPDVDAALALAKQLISGEAAEGEPDDAEALFQGGYAGARGQLNKG